MNPHKTALLLAACFLGLASGPNHEAQGQEPPAPLAKDHAAQMARGLDLFKKQVRPVLEKSCLKCHGGKETEAGLDLSDRAGLLKGGESGPAIIAGRGKDSLLYKLAAHAKEPFMPFQGKKLPDEALAALAAWIDLGAPYDRPLLERNAAADWIRAKVPDQARQFWSFQPLRPVQPPAVNEPSWGRTPVDRFILQKLEGAGIKPNPLADRRTLIRRAYFDLIGLPPPPEEVEAFVQNPDPRAYEELVDRLLASPHHGERWGRHWLDLARFAESHGFEHDYDRPTAYTYRDFVIKALNQDLPYDTFVKWQLAGDELAPDDNLALTATGFLAAGVHSTQITKREVEKHRYDELDDMLATTGTAMLGLTIGCARCHDHKYDPIPQADYYRLLSTFTATVRSEVDLDLDPEGYRQAKAEFDRAHAPLTAAVRRFEETELPKRRPALAEAWASDPDRLALAALDGMFRRGPRLTALGQWWRTADPEWLRLKKAELDHLRHEPRRKTEKALISTEGLKAVRLHTQGEDLLPETHFLRRGDPEQKEAVATQGFLQVLVASADQEARWHVPPPTGWRTSYRRVALANWMTDVDHGAGALLARVIVNRLWQQHLGRGIVATPSDFGLRGDKPTHPELLDWLAAELIKGGWRLKPMHKLIMTSSVYMQTSAFDEGRARVDRDNKLCWRRPARRLEGEVIRDAMLAVSGTLDDRMFGPGTLDESSRRRSIYFTVKRSKLIPMLLVFDAPEALVSLAERPATTIAPQALLLMNNPRVREYARDLARRSAAPGGAPAEAVRRAYALALARPPGETELADALAFLEQQAASYAAAGRPEPSLLALADFCQALFCLNEFVYVE